MRVQEVTGRLQLGTVRPMDDARIAEMQETILAMTQLNRDIWDFLGMLQKLPGEGEGADDVAVFREGTA